MATALAPKPRVKKKKLTVNQAGDQWVAVKREMDRLKPLLDEAAEVMLAHFEKSGRRTWKDRITVNTTGGNLVLDQTAVRAYLGAKWSKFQKRSKTGKSLKLIE